MIDFTDPVFYIELAIGLAILIAAAVTVRKSFFTVEQQKVAVVERFGKFHRLAEAGLNRRNPFTDKIAGQLDLRVFQLNVPVETKTKDNVFVKVIVSVQYFVQKGKEYEAWYKLANAAAQITSYVEDAVRAEVPKMDLDKVFETKDAIALVVKNELTEVMGTFGYTIQKALVTDVNPDAKVKESMNNINAAQRNQAAANAQGEANKTLKVKAAEADAETMRLHGEGVAEQRMAIARGMKDSADLLRESLPGSTSREVMGLMLTSQYFDTLKEVAKDGKTNTIFLNHAPGAVGDISTQMMEGALGAREAAQPDPKTADPKQKPKEAIPVKA